MGTTTLTGNPPIEVTLRRSAQARRLSLRVSALDGRVTLSVPRRTSERSALAFLQAREDWVRDALARQAPAVQVGIGGRVAFEGRDLPVIAGPGRGVRLGPDSIAIPDGPRGVPALRAALREAARARLSAASEHYARRLGARVGRITLRDTRSRWGSCSSAGDLMYSWRLILAPVPVLDYVAAHEVAHLCRMDHSPAFWSLVAELCPDHAAQRRWLREEGAGLHRWRFGD
ncbi:M48 family peptidase [Mesobaculum littorinae]|uniref:M48 family peptidase n=1 Tax=Mesobaculum littorinae TaxID=2486419 RepID=A0A438AD38_9RHOB|nr:SprT family zinc-dependent metalloprotease [Mesobaculum littorinae]RVV96621.1 M48 family peptidase [Mesobaculum littorinae]